MKMIKSGCWSATIKGTFLLTYVLAMTWAYGFLLISNRTTFLEYGFIFSNAAQGICFFVLYCYTNKEVRTSWQRLEVKKPKPVAKLSNIVAPSPQPTMTPVKALTPVKTIDTPMTEAEEEKKAEVKKEMWKAFDALIVDDGDEVEEIESEDDAPRKTKKTGGKK